MLELSWNTLRDAIAIYLKCAYPAGIIPEVVQRRLAFDESRSVSESLGSPPFENYVAEAPDRCTVYALRLGSAEYPNLKMEIRPFPSSRGFMFWVNTHDQFVAVTAGMPDADRWANVMRRNREVKQEVERAWAAHKLPTFLSTMQEELAEARGPDY